MQISSLVSVQCCVVMEDTPVTSDPGPDTLDKRLPDHMTLVEDILAIRRLFECTVCLSHFHDPRLLDCGHQFCLKCLRGLKIRHSVITCPLCQHGSRMKDEGGVKCLPLEGLFVEVQDKVMSLPTGSAQELREQRERESRPLENLTLTRTLEFRVKVKAMAFDSRNRKLVVRVGDKHAPIRVYNTDDWSLYDEFGGSVKDITRGDNQDVCVDTKRNVYVINTSSWTGLGKLVRVNPDGTYRDKFEFRSPTRQMTSLDYSRYSDVYVCHVKVVYYFRDESHVEIISAGSLQKLRNVSITCSLPGSVVRVGMLDKRPVFVISDINSVNLYDLESGVTLRSHSTYHTLGGRERALRDCGGVCLGSGGQILVADVGNTCLVGIWRNRKHVTKREIATDIRLRSSPQVLAIDPRDRTVCVLSKNRKQLRVFQPTTEIKNTPDSVKKREKSLLLVAKYIFLLMLSISSALVLAWYIY